MNSMLKPIGAPIDTHFMRVGLFQLAVLKQQFPDKPRLLSTELMQAQIRCLDEELLELGDATLQHDLVGVTDAIVDLIYFALGFAYRLGLPYDQVFEIVHKANMRKVIGMTKRGNTDDAAKPDGWVSPEQQIKELLYGQQKTND